MGTHGKARLGTPVTPITPTIASQANRNVPPKPSQPPSIPPPAPVIPVSLLQPNEQRLLITSFFGLLEVWDILAPYFTNPEPSWSNSLRLAGPISATAWTIFELLLILSVGFLRIPQLSPSLSVPNLLQIAGLLVAWNAVCWIVSTPGAAFELLRVDLIGPPSLGGANLWSLVKSVGWKEKPHLGGRHQIRLLPYSTATLNPLSLSYCIPPDSSQPLYIPIIFNNSVPDQVTYFIRSLETGHTETKTVSGSSLRRSSHSDQQIEPADDEENDSDSPEVDPLSAMVLRTQGKEVAKMPSVKPADSLALIPQQLASSQSILFITVEQPSLISLKSVVDKRGDRFQITAHKEAVVIECPTGGHFMDENKGAMIKKGDKIQPAEQRCVGDEEVAQFQARGVGSLKVAWTMTSASTKEPKTSGVIEGIEDDVETVDTLGLVRRDKVSKTHTVPLRLTHEKPGIYTVSLTKVTDSLHNTYCPSGHSAQKVYNVLPRITANLQCPSPYQLLVNKTVSIPIIISGGSDSSSAKEINYSLRSLQGEVSTHSMKLSKKNELITVSEPGTYTLLDLSGQCSGGVIEPSSCRVQLISPPALDMTVITLNEGAMDIGVNAVFEFTGTPPFKVHWTEQRKGSRVVEQSRKFDAHHGEVILQPEHEGQYTYTFNAVSDKHYSNIKLDEEPIHQTVHPLANVDIPGLRNGITRRKLYSCSGDNIDIDLEAKGNPPLSLNYLLSYGSKLENKTIGIEAGRSKLGLTVPKELNSESGASGKLSVTLLSIQDGDGRVRKLPAPTVEVDIHRQKPTVRFAKSGRVVITEGENTQAPLRLTGDAPWEVTYSLNGGKAKKVNLRDANNHLTLSEAGVYRLVEVKDANCPGTVARDDTFEIAFKPRPTVEIIQSGAISQVGGTWKHKGFCTGGEDQVALRFNGQGPYEATYRYTIAGHTSRHTLKSAQETGILHLNTEPGQHRYDFTELKDINYANNPIQLSVQHDVYSRPSASFVKSNSKPLCLDQELKSDAKIRLEGQAPFTINLAVRKPASTKVVSHTITTNDKEWKLELPVAVKEIGRYEISIVSMSDISDCEQIVYETDKLVTTVEVVESARIVPVSQNRDLCVGDNLDFLLQGKAPWTIEYEWLKKKHTVTSSASRFSRYAESPGNFSIHSVALKDNQCKRKVDDLLRIVHPLPSVQIQEGLVHLREGDDPASFSVHFTGTPPFTFTYTRSQLVGSRTKILDTQTVTDIMESDYTISSSLEGDYEVTSVADKWCRYPPLTKGRNEV